MDVNKSDKDRISQLLQLGSEIAGSAVAGAIGYLAAGPVGAAAMGALGASAQITLREMATRYLSNREAIRIGGAAAIALDDIKVRIENGDQVRNDVFMEKDAFGNRPCEEILEGILLKAKDSYEQKKVLYFAKLYVEIVFDDTCTMPEANYLINLSEDLTYMQFCLLRLFSARGLVSLRIDSVHDKEVPFSQMSLLQSTHELFSKNLIEILQRGTTEFVVDIVSPKGIIPGDCILSSQGKRLYEMLGLAEMPYADWESLGKDL